MTGDGGSIQSFVALDERSSSSSQSVVHATSVERAYTRGILLLLCYDCCPILPFRVVEFRGAISGHLDLWRETRLGEGLSAYLGGTFLQA